MSATTTQAPLTEAEVKAFVEDWYLVKLDQHVPPDVIPLSRQVVGFEIDRARLIDAVAANAPDVEVVDVDLDGAAYPATPERPRRSPWTWR